MEAGVIGNIALSASNLDSKQKTNSDALPQTGSGNDFFSYLKNSLQEVDDLQQQAATSAQKLALGDEEYLHNTVIAYEKANLALQLTIEVRNKVVEAFQEIMRIQM